jgi:hypothetical protein
MSIDGAPSRPAPWLGFEYEGLRIRVESSNPSHLTWLEEFLAPQFEPTDGGSFAWRVAFAGDPERFDAVLARGPRPDRAVLDVFALDADVVRLPAWNSEESSTTVFEDRYPAFYSVDASNRSVAILAREADRSSRIALMRVVRELAMNHALRSGGLFLHASASSFGGRGAVVTGPRTAGKTTLLVYLLSHGARFVGNDRVLVRNAEDRVTARGMPTLVAIRSGTLELFPALRDRLLASHYFSSRTLDESRRMAGHPAPSPVDDKIGVSPAQLLSLLDAEPQAGCDVGAILFPRVTAEVEAFELELLDAPDASRRFGSALLGVHPWKKGADVFSIPGDPEPLDAARLAALCDTLAGKVRCYECRLGRAAYRDDGLAKAVTRALDA